MTWQSIEGWFGTKDGEVYAERVAAAPTVAHFVEVGSWQGRSSACMAEAIRDSGKLIRFDCVDTFKGSLYGSHPDIVASLEARGETLRTLFEEHLRELGLWRYVNPVEGQSVGVAGSYEDRSLDFVYLDADHRAEQVAMDVKAWYPKIAPGGAIGGHDWKNPEVQRGLYIALLDLFPDPPLPEIRSKETSWWIEVAAAPEPDVTAAFPTRYPGAESYYGHLYEGFQQIGQVWQSEGLDKCGHWSPPGVRGRDPIHIALLEINGHPVWYDFSDFPEMPPDRHDSIPPAAHWTDHPYFKMQVKRSDVGGNVHASGQILGTLTGPFHDHLPRLRRMAQQEPPPDAPSVVACFSNIDELNNPPRRKWAVEMLRDFPGAVTSFWQFSSLRPPVPSNLAGKKMPPEDHWRRLALSRTVLALPGVGGDLTRLHAETMAIGSCLVTIETDQAWPGNWRSPEGGAACWVEVDRKLEGLVETIRRLNADPEETDRVARLGAWYYEANLRPDQMARRMAREAR